MEEATTLSPFRKCPSTISTRHMTPRYSSWKASNKSTRRGPAVLPGGGGIRSMTAGRMDSRPSPANSKRITCISTWLDFPHFFIRSDERYVRTCLCRCHQTILWRYVKDLHVAIQGVYMASKSPPLPSFTDILQESYVGLHSQRTWCICSATVSGSAAGRSTLFKTGTIATS